MRHISVIFVALAAAVLLALPALAGAAETRTIVDAQNREVVIPAKLTRVICSGPGCLRLLTYLQSQNLAVAVDDIEGRRRQFDARPYAMANPQFKKLPIFGEFRGHDNPELIAALNPQPQVIFKTYATMGHDPVELQAKTGIPVIILNYGNLGPQRDKFYQALRIMGDAVGKKDRAEEVVAFFKTNIEQLAALSAKSKDNRDATVFVGGVAFKGPHGFQSTEPTYPPFAFIGAKNAVTASKGDGVAIKQSNVAKEKILEWDPDYLFLDLATLQLGDDAGGWHELKTDPAYQALTAVHEGRVYGVLPYNWYSRNYGSILADAWFIGKLLHPDTFTDVDPAAKANEIYTFLVGKPVFADMDAMFQNMAFKPVPLK